MTIKFVDTNTVAASGSAETLSASDDLTVAAGIQVGATDGASAAINATGAAVEIAIYGDIFGKTGISLTGGANDIQIGVGGAVSGYTAQGIYAGGGFNNIINDGDVSGGTQAVFVADGQNLLVNNGEMSSPGGYTIEFLAGGDVITNNGTLSGSVPILLSTGPADAPDEINNSGAILTLDGSGADAISPGNAAATVLNAGYISGGIDFGESADVYKGAQGIITGTIDGGEGNDILKGGAGDESFEGGAGADKMNGGGGDNVFIYTAAGESTGHTFDIITGFDADHDSFDMPAAVKAVNASVTAGELRSGSHFNTDLAAAIGSAQLGKNGAVLFTPTKGTYAHDTFLIIDGNHTAGYQAGADYVIQLQHGQNLGDLDVASFV